MINTETYFLSNEIRQKVVETIQRLENALNEQQAIDSYWADIKRLFLNYILGKDTVCVGKKL